MRLYWGPHTCAIGIHVLLEEIGRPYQTERVDVGGGENRLPPFLEINPKGKVPTLVRDDGSVLTEFGAIAGWLARTDPDAGLLPQDLDEIARVEEVVAYVEGTIHGQGYARIFVPALFEPQDLVHGKLGLGQASVKAQGRQIVETGFAILNPQLSRHEFAAGDTFSIADAAMFYAERWAASNDITLPMHVQAHFNRIRVRPAVQRVMEAWGEAD